MDIGQLRQYFKEEHLHEDILDNPYDQFEIWFNDACRAKIEIPNAMTLTTLDQGMPVSRTVLLRKMERDGFSFFTRYDSPLADQINASPVASLHFFWPEVDRQVAISGSLEKTSVSESRKFFSSCNRKVRLAARAPRMEEVGGFEQLREKLEELDIQFDGAQIPMPDWWGGYRIVPIRFEFWQGQTDCLHERFEFTLIENGKWVHTRISP
jgi:pyridoxamine 5'-phosphate oxidase